jgi:predicted permease
MYRWLTLFRRRRLERELEAELRFHFERQVEDNLAAGMTLEAARRRAALEFGGLEQVKEACRDERPSIMLEQFFQDLRYAFRQLRKAPGFALTAILTVAIGIGACSALFSIVNGVLLRPLGFPNPEEIVTLTETRLPDVRTPLAPAIFKDWQEQTSVFQHLAAFRWRSYNSARDGGALSINAQLVTADYFAVLGVQPLLGRAFTHEEEVEGGHHVLILSYRTWQNHFGGRPTVLSESVILDDQPYAIVGVMPDKNLIWNPPIFTPLAFTAYQRSDYGSHGLSCIARLKSRRTIEQAQRELDVVSSQIARAHPDSNTGHGGLITPLLDSIIQDVRSQLWVLLGAVGLLLMIACVNVAGLLLARANSRLKEIAVRAALGASRSRIVRQFLCESFLISTTGGILGVGLALASMKALLRFAGHYLPRTRDVALDANVLACTVALMLLAGLIVGLIPALQATRGDMAEAMNDAGRGSSTGKRRQRARSTLVVAEVALALMLLAGTGLLVRSLSALQKVDQGFKPDNVYLAGMSLGSAKRYDTSGKIIEFMNVTLERISTLPGVQSVAITTGVPMVGASGLLYNVSGDTATPLTSLPVTEANAVTPDYFKVMSIPLVRGRSFDGRDVEGSPRVVIINEELAHRHFSAVNPIGQRLMIYTMDDKPDGFREIVGVVGSVRPGGPQSELTPQIYEPLSQHPQRHGLNVIVRTNGVVPGLTAAVKDTLHALNPDIPFDGLWTYAGRVATAWFRQQFSLVLFTLFSVVALLLAALGIYGVIAFSVQQRTHEIGIRMALGAKSTDVVRLILRHGAKLVGVGLALGLVGAAICSHVLESLLFNVSPSDPLTLLAVALILGSVAAIACWIPARRAMKVDPLVALRSE